MDAYTPVPASPPDTGWEHLERFPIDTRADVEWGVAPSLETLGRLVVLRADLDSDVERLVGLRDRLDELLAAATCAWREADDAEGGQ